MKLSKKYFNLRKGSKIKINEKLFTIREKISENKIIRYGLGNNYVLEYDNDWAFFKLETKKFLGFEIKRSKIIKIEDIKANKQMEKIPVSLTK